MKRIIAYSITLGLMAATAGAQTIADCDWRASASAIPEPWSENTRTFANGEVRLALLDTIEPAASAFHLLILSPPYDLTGGRMCKVVSYGESLGYMGLDFGGLEAEYDPAVGLVFTLPGRLYSPEDDFSNALELTVTLNQATGEVTARHALGRD